MQLRGCRGLHAEIEGFGSVNVWLHEDTKYVKCGVSVYFPSVLLGLSFSRFSVAAPCQL